MKRKAFISLPWLASVLSACDSKPADPPPPAGTGNMPADGTAANVAADKAVDDAIEGNLGDHQRYRDVIDALKAGVSAGDAATVAALVHYPIRVGIGGKDTVLKNEAEFVARYQDVMTPGIRDAITGTEYRDLFVNYKGVSFGRGQAWINGICQDNACKEVEVKVVTLQHGPE